MQTQNITLALKKRLIARAKRFAAERKISMSMLLTQSLEEKIQREEGYAQAKARALALLQQGYHMGQRSGGSWTRESLHAR